MKKVFILALLLAWAICPVKSTAANKDARMDKKLLTNADPFILYHDGVYYAYDKSAYPTPQTEIINKSYSFE